MPYPKDFLCWCFAPSLFMLSLPLQAADTACLPLHTGGITSLPTEQVGSAAHAAPKKVALLLQGGLLKPQVTAILKKHFDISVLDWQASPHHQWPTEYRVDALSWAELLGRVLDPYQLQLIIHPNRSAVVRYRHHDVAKHAS